MAGLASCNTALNPFPLGSRSANPENTFAFVRCTSLLTKVIVSACWPKNGA